MTSPDRELFVLVTGHISPLWPLLAVDERTQMYTPLLRRGQSAGRRPKGSRAGGTPSRTTPRCTGSRGACGVPSSRPGGGSTSSSERRFWTASTNSAKRRSGESSQSGSSPARASRSRRSCRAPCGSLGRRSGAHARAAVGPATPRRAQRPRTDRPAPRRSICPAAQQRRRSGTRRRSSANCWRACCRACCACTSAVRSGPAPGTVVGGLLLNVVPSLVLIPLLAGLLLLSAVKVWQHE